MTEHTYSQQEVDALVQAAEVAGFDAGWEEAISETMTEEERKRIQANGRGELSKAIAAAEAAMCQRCADSLERTVVRAGGIATIRAMADEIRALATPGQQSALAERDKKYFGRGIAIAKRALRNAALERGIDNAKDFFEEYLAIELKAADSRGEEYWNP